MSSPQLLSAWAGHWTGEGTGVTVIVPPPGTVGSGEVRGGAPATREFALLEPTRLVDRIDAVVLSGGSAFGLAAGDAVMRELRSRGLGFATPAGPVPIVVGMSLFDAAVVDPPDYSPGARAALEAALSGAAFETGRVGAGTGATTGKWRGRFDPSGIGLARGRAGAASIVTLAAVNAWGDVIGPDGQALVSPSPSDATPKPSPFTQPSHGAAPQPSPFAQPSSGAAPQPSPFTQPSSGAALQPPSGAAPGTNTTIAVVLTDAKLDKNACNLLAQSGHTGFARALNPAHTSYDGDAVVALATGELSTEVDLEHLRMVTADLMAEAIRSATA
ncbi:P1 family peptidase [Actinoplanes bogorensis]|uniref:P1 family peptidase n=1 Tax=Paractinoplanes bogorensis TaxID=1610840 RepID=A0ABS5Z4W7_9ACTN|nr:P1 family peptidase [Actinoplanes bogorensis]MBU2670733.1 P1 family peptidase [Actinoplanes bogorensis]